MIFRCFLIITITLLFTSAAQAAAFGVWNCEQGKNGEWTCLTETPSNAEATKPQPAEVKPAPSVPVVQTPSKPEPPVPVVQGPSKPEPQNAQPSQPPVISAPVATKPVPNSVPETSPAISSEPLARTEKPTKSAPKPKVHITQNHKPHLEKVEPVAEVEQNTSQPKQPGWDCHAGEDKQNWNCNLAGADPKGEARPVVNNKNEQGIVKPAFTNSQENTFQLLRGEFKQDPWQDCQVWAIKKRRMPVVSQQIRDNADTDVNADFSEAFEGEVMSFSGNVDLTRADQHLLAQNANYDTAAGSLDAQGGVVYTESSMAVSSETLSMNLNSNEARIRKALFLMGDGPLRGSAEAIYRDEDLQRYNDTAFTSCAPGNQDWVMHASRLKINRESGQGSAKDAWLEFKGWPVLYTPYISFPTDNRRLSGFLSPTWGSTQRSGFYIAAPFYWNIAPNVDSIITPRYFSGRGEMLSNKLRYLTEISKGTLGAEFMPNDRKLNKARYSFSIKDNTSFSPNLNSQVDLNLVSDRTYFNDLNNALGFQRSSYLPSKAYVNYDKPDINFVAGMQHYQSVDPTVLNSAMPYDLLPRVGFNLNHNFEGMPLRLGLQTQYSNFFHQVLVNGQRLTVWPSIAMPFESTAGFFTPKVSLQSTQYELSNKDPSIAGTPSNINRTLPIFSVDSGLSFEKSLDFDNTAYNNIIEPRLFYLYIPRKDQNNIPVFDTSAYDINFNSLFRENSFSGLDRMQDANQISLAASTRFINAKTGLEPLKLSLGQILYFQNRTVTLTSTNQPLAGIYSAQKSATSNFISELSGQIDEHLSYNTGAQWNTEQNKFARGQAMLKYRNQPDQIFDIGYRYRSAGANPLITPINGTYTVTPNTQQTISLADTSFRWPIYNDWYALGRWQYSLNFNKTLESFMGLEKENCCWRFRIIVRRYINGATTTNYLAPNLAPETAFFVQLELKGLSGIGDDVDTFLQTSLNGYRKAGSY